MDYKGWALFADGDMLCLDDISKLFDLADDSQAVMVVKHDYKTQYPTKYLGAKNEDYPRKNWSSVVLFNCAHPANRCLTKTFIEASNGAYLHRFGWLNDDQIGELPKEWNHLVLENEENLKAKIVHYTVYGPYHNGHEDVEFVNEWRNAFVNMNRCDQA
jgi:lipopolysaccharide biosynthesis glycosyltransferase